MDNILFCSVFKFSIDRCILFLFSGNLLVGKYEILETTLTYVRLEKTNFNSKKSQQRTTLQLDGDIVLVYREMERTNVNVNVLYNVPVCTFQLQ